MTEGTLNFEFEYTLYDRLAMIKWIASENHPKRLVAAIATTPTFVGASLLPFGVHVSLNAIWIGYVVIAVLGFSWLFLRPILRRRFERWCSDSRRAPNLLGLRKIIIQPKSLGIAANIFRRELSWVAVGKIEQTSEGLFFADVMESNPPILFIPVRVFANTAEVDSTHRQCIEFQIAASKRELCAPTPETTPVNFAYSDAINERTVSGKVVRKIGCAVMGLFMPLVIMCAAMICLGIFIVVTVFIRTNWQNIPTSQPAVPGQSAPPASTQLATQPT